MIGYLVYLLIGYKIFLVKQGNHKTLHVTGRRDFCCHFVLWVVFPSIGVAALSLFMGEYFLAAQVYGLLIGTLCLLFMQKGLFSIETDKLEGLQRQAALLPSNSVLPDSSFLSRDQDPLYHPPLQNSAA